MRIYFHLAGYVRCSPQVGWNGPVCWRTTSSAKPAGEAPELTTSLCACYAPRCSRPPKAAIATSRALVLKPAQVDRQVAGGRTVRRDHGGEPVPVTSAALLGLLSQPVAALLEVVPLGGHSGSNSWASGSRSPRSSSDSSRHPAVRPAAPAGVLVSRAAGGNRAGGRRRSGPRPPAAADDRAPARRRPGGRPCGW